MLLLHMQGIVPVDFRRAFYPLEGGGGAQTYWHQAYNIQLKYVYVTNIFQIQKLHVIFLIFNILKVV